jgi:hypothetical protein
VTVAAPRKFGSVGYETGTDTFIRYRDQAEVAFPICLRFAKVGDVLSVTPEGLEDLLVEEPVRWRFIQVKTRDAGLGGWLYGDLLAIVVGCGASFERTRS